METQIETTQSSSHAFFVGLGEILAVFLPVLILFRVAGSWIGQDPVRSMAVIWIANILMLLIVWALIRRRGISWKELGLSFNRLSAGEALRVFLLSLLVFVIGISAYLIAPLLMASINGIPESADFTRYEFLRNNPWGLVVSLIGVYVVSSFGEEVIYRAFLIHVISDMLKSLRYNIAIAVVGSAVIFGLAHYEWGIMGIIQTGMMGLAMGICYIKLKKKLWVLILAHAYMDTILLVQLYLASN